MLSVCTHCYIAQVIRNIVKTAQISAIRIALYSQCVFIYQNYVSLIIICN